MKNTPEEVRARFVAEGVSIWQWALSKGYSPRLVYAVLNGHRKATRGVTHRIAIDLGLKEEPEHKRFAA